METKIQCKSMATITHILQSSRKKFIQVWNNMRVSQWWHNFHFWLNNPYKPETFSTHGHEVFPTCEPAYDVLLLMTTLWILPNFPKYSGRFRTYKMIKVTVIPSSELLHEQLRWIMSTYYISHNQTVKWLWGRKFPFVQQNVNSSLTKTLYFCAILIYLPQEVIHFSLM